MTTSCSCRRSTRRRRCRRPNKIGQSLTGLVVATGSRSSSRIPISATRAGPSRGLARGDIARSWRAAPVGAGLGCPEHSNDERRRGFRGGRSIATASRPRQRLRSGMPLYRLRGASDSSRLSVRTGSDLAEKPRGSVMLSESFHALPERHTRVAIADPVARVLRPRADSAWIPMLADRDRDPGLPMRGRAEHRRVAHAEYVQTLAASAAAESPPGRWRAPWVCRPPLIAYDHRGVLSMFFHERSFPRVTELMARSRRPAAIAGAHAQHCSCGDPSDPLETLQGVSLQLSKNKPVGPAPTISERVSTLCSESVGFRRVEGAERVLAGSWAMLVNS